MTDAEALAAAIKRASEVGCIRMHWGARRPCDEYTDGRELCAPCALRVELAKSTSTSGMDIPTADS